MGSYLVTGGCGFIGSHLSDRLLADGHRVRVLDDLSTGHRHNLSSRAELIVGDVADPACVAAAIAGVDGCFHLAAIASVQQSVENWLGTHETNLTGAITVFEAARTANSKPIPVVYASSAAIYGDCAAVPLSEQSPARPLSAYGADKFGCELHARVATLVHGVPTCGFRFFNVFGPRQDPRSPYSGVISIFVDRLLKGQALTVYGDGRQQRDFVFVGDVVDHLVAAMEPGRTEPRVFNVCRGAGTEIVEIAHILGDVLNVQPHLKFAPAKPGDIYVSIGDPTAAIRDLGVRAETSLWTGLSLTVADMQTSLVA